MKKNFLILFCILILCGCQRNKVNDDDNQISESEINAKYEEMKNKLIEYGRLVYVNEQWLNEDAKLGVYSTTLNDLYERNGYDISMFVNPETSEKCDLDKTKIEFKISDISDLNNVKYGFTPILVCGDFSSGLELEYAGNEYYEKLYDKMFDYMVEIYDIDNVNANSLDSGTYKVTLNDFKKMGYDISMFKSQNSGNECNLDETYVVLEVLDDLNEQGFKYLFSYDFNCEE